MSRFSLASVAVLTLVLFGSAGGAVNAAEGMHAAHGAKAQGGNAAANVARGARERTARRNKPLSGRS